MRGRSFRPVSSLRGHVRSAAAGPASRRGSGRQWPQPKRDWRSSQTDLLVRVNAGQLITAGRIYRDVTAALELKGGHLRQLQLRLSGDEGYSLELEGSVDDVADAPEGRAARAGGGRTAAGVAPLAELLGMPRASARRAARAGDGAVAPRRIDDVRRPHGDSSDLMLDGEANGAGVKVNARLDGGAGGWRTGRADVTASVEGPDGGRTSRLSWAGGTSAGGARPGRILVKATALPDEGLATIASLEAGDLALGFRGQVPLAEAGISIAGDLEFRAAMPRALPRWPVCRRR